MTALSWANGPDSLPLLEETIGENLADITAAHGDRDALISRHQGIRWTYSQFAEEVERVARGLLGMGFAKADRVGIWSPNNAEWVLMQYATARIGVILVNINPAYRTHELHYALEQSGCRALVAATQFKTSDYVSMVEEVRGDLPNLEHVIFIGTKNWSDMLVAGEPLPTDAVAQVERTLDPDDPINIQYTSGTTGFPKGATLTHRNILNNGYFVGETCRYTPDDRVCIPVPLYHCFGMVLGNLAVTTHGAAMVFPGEAFDPKETLDAVAEERGTSL